MRSIFGVTVTLGNISCKMEAKSFNDSLYCYMVTKESAGEEWCDEQFPKGSCSMSMYIFSRHSDEGLSFQSPMRASPVIVTFVSLNLCGIAFASQ